MKAKYFPIAMLIVLMACNDKHKDQGEIDDPGNATPTVSNMKNTNKKGFKTNIEKDALVNANFRKVLYTGEHMQLVLMDLKPSEEIGEETHMKSDQFFRFESGHGKCVVNGTSYDVTAGDVVLVPSGVKHNVINTDPKESLKLYTIYAMPNHKDGIVRATKEEASRQEAKFDGKTSE